MQKKHIRNGMVLLSMAMLLNASPLPTMNSFGAGFVPSITTKGTPDVEKVVDKTGKPVEDEIVITPYYDRDTMPDPKKEDFEKSYEEVDMDRISEEIKEGLEIGIVVPPDEWGGRPVELKPEDLSVTDIFYVHEKNDTGTVQLGVEVTMDDPVGPHDILIVMTFKDNKWEVVPLTRFDDKFTFKVEAYGAYMLVTNTVLEVMGEAVSPQTGEPEIDGLLGTVMKILSNKNSSLKLDR